MTNVGDSEKLSPGNRLDGLSHQDSIHYDPVPGGKVCGGELMLGGNIGRQNPALGVPLDTFAPFQIGQRNQNIVTGIDFENAGSHRRGTV